MIDARNNIVLRSKGNKVEIVLLKQRLSELGYLIDSSSETGNIWDILDIFMKHFNIRTDGFFFLITISLILISNFIAGYSELLTGIF